MSQRGDERPPQGVAALGDETEARASIAGLTAAARACEGQGAHDESVRSLQKAALLADALNDQTLVGDLLIQCAEVFCAIGEFRMASRFLGRAREIARDSSGEELKGEVYRGYGQLYKARGDRGSAAICFDRALERFEFTTRHRSVRRTLLDLSEIYLKQGRSAEASHLLERAESIPVDADPGVEMRIRLNRGRIAHLEGDGTKALAEYEEAARIAQMADRAFEREIVAIGLADLHVRGGRLDLALLSLREALALSVVAFSRKALRPIERARFDAMGRLLRLIVALSVREGPGFPHALQVDEALRLHDAHPFVLTGQVRPYHASGKEKAARAPGAPEIHRVETSSGISAPKY